MLLLLAALAFAGKPNIAPLVHEATIDAPVSQVWVSAQMKSFKLDWDSKRSAFVLPQNGQTLVELVAGAVGEQIGEKVSL